MRIPSPWLLAILVANVNSVGQEVYSNDFNGPVGTRYPEWTSSPIAYRSRATPPGAGELPAPVVTNTESPNGAQRFLGEFGGPAIGAPGDPGYNRTRVDQTISLILAHLPAHAFLTVSFDLYILKSWDGESPAWGPDRFLFAIAGGPTLLDTTFSNNPKTETEGSFQSYPRPKSKPRAGALAIGSLGYNRFFADAIYRFAYTFEHTVDGVTLNFTSSLFEGKGTADESWGLDNVRVSATARPPERPEKP